MKDNLVWNIIIKAIICLSKKYKDLGIFPQFLVMGSVWKLQTASDHYGLFTHTLRLLVWNDHHELSFTEGLCFQMDELVHECL